MRCVGLAAIDPMSVTVAILAQGTFWAVALAAGLFAKMEKLFTLLDLCVSSLRRGHANLLCIVPILTDDPRRESNELFGGRCSVRCDIRGPSYP